MLSNPVEGKIVLKPTKIAIAETSDGTEPSYLVKSTLLMRCIVAQSKGRLGNGLTDTSIFGGFGRGWDGGLGRDCALPTILRGTVIKRYSTHDIR